MNSKKLEKAIIFGLVLTVSVAFISQFSQFSAQCDDIRSKVLRLHILANSDSSEDQALKIKVRDRILTASSELFKKSADKEEAEKNVRENLDKIKKVAEDEVKREGFDYAVNAELVNMYFTTRTYDNVTLPAGNYDAVRITIGKAAGHNWWCVLFPSLCIPAASDKQKVDDVLDKDETEIVTNPDSVVVKFKTVEIVEQIKSWFVTNFS